MMHSSCIGIADALQKGMGALAFAALTFLSVSTASAADLLRPRLKPSKQPAPREAAAGRFRAVEVHLQALEATTCEVTLFPGETLSLERVEWTQLPNGDRVWSGRIVNEPLSRATFAVRGKTLSGVIDRAMTTGNELFEITPSPSGYQVFQHDPDRLPPVLSQTLPAPIPTGRQAVPAGADPTVDQPVIDLMVVYTPASRARYGKEGLEAKILQAVADANTAFVNSRINARFALVHLSEIAYTETGLSSTALVALQRTSDGQLDEVHALRDAHGADLVALISEDTSSCGLSYVMATPSPGFAGNAFSVVYSGCLASLSLAHELGHLLGCQHDRSSTSGAAAFPYAYGWRQCDPDGPQFRTIMAEACGGAIRVNYFSNPALEYSGSPLGIDATLDPSNGADNARAINQTASIAAAFRTLPPAAPTGLAANLQGTPAVQLSWTDNASSESEYIVERSTGASPASWTVLAVLPRDTTGHTDNTVAVGTTFSYRVFARNSAGSSASTATVTVTVPAPVPKTPSNITANAAPGQVSIGWTDESDNETGFRLERSANGGVFFFWIQLPANTTSYLDPQVSTGGTYAYRISAVNAAGRSGTIESAAVVVPSAIPPAPTNVSLTATPSSVTVTWLDLASNETGYRLERSANGGAFLLWINLPANTTSYTDTLVTTGSTYSYRLIANSTTGSSPPSSAPSITVPGIPPTAPAGLVAAAVSRTQINLNWSDTSLTETGFTIDRSLNGTSWTPLANVGPNVQTYSNTGLKQNTLYYYRVRAYNAWGSSPATAVVSLRTNP